MLRLCRCLLHQLRDEVLDHLLDLDERIRLDALGDERQHTATKFLTLRLQELGNLGLVAIIPSTKLSKRAASLDHSWPVLVSIA